jgi:hypothetical protein
MHISSYKLPAIKKWMLAERINKLSRSFFLLDFSRLLTGIGLPAAAIL